MLLEPENKIEIMKKNSKETTNVYLFTYLQKYNIVCRR